MRRTTGTNAGKQGRARRSRGPLRSLLVPLLAAGLLLCPLRVLGGVPRVVASILPVHGIVSDVMRGVGEPVLLLPPGRSPHGHGLKPSDARMLADAELLVWVGPGLEGFLVKPSRTIEAELLELMGAPGIHKLPYRTAHDHEEHGEHDARHDHEEHHNHEEHHGHEEHHDHEEHHAKEEHHAEEENGIDPHLWLSIDNARVIATLVADSLAVLDPENADSYRANARRARSSYAALSERVAARLRPHRGRAFLTLHDFHQYFDREFDLEYGGSLILRPGLGAGVDTVRRLRRRVAESGVRCVFGEPQMPTGLLETVVEGSRVAVGVLDPLGIAVDAGPGAYVAVMDDLSIALADCLAGDRP